MAAAAVAALAAVAETQGRNDRPERGMMFFSSDLLDEFASLWFQAPLVMSSRMQGFAVSGMSGSTGGAAEASQMLTEKLSAVAESVVAMNTAMVKEGIATAAAFAMGTSTGLAGASDRVAVAALKPYGQRVRANVLRLSK